MSIENPSPEIYFKYATYYEVSYSDGRLKVEWHHIMDNCASIAHHASMYKEGNVLSFCAYKVASGEVANCICSYEVSSEFDGIEPGHYTIQLDDNEFYVDLAENSNFKLYPPMETTKIETTILDEEMLKLSADKVLTINATSEYTLDIYNIDGTKITILSGNSTDELDLNTLPSGAYILRLASGRKTLSRRIML